VLTFSIHTLGCKLNQLEGEALADAFRREGFPVIPWEEGLSGAPAGEGAPSPERLMLINTCTVTSMADQKARRLIRAALREGALVLVTGCYAQLNPRELAALGEGGRLIVVGGERKSALLDLPRRLAGEGGIFSEPVLAWLRGLSGGAPPESPRAEPFRFAPRDFSAHTRGFLKIQDGCDRHCAYCRVRLARGRSISLDPEEALRRLRDLEAAGRMEAVLTGVNICRYAWEEGGALLDLGGLLDRLLKGTERIRLRLSSLEPEDLNASLLASLAAGRLRPHFHLSVQSGSGRVLARMGRSYGPERVEEAVSQLRRLKGDPFLACDIIVGFPGEGEADFQETVELCERLDFAWIHVFPYSPRPGTPAWDFKGRLPQREIRARAERLGELACRGRRNYIGRWIGREVELVPERGLSVPPAPEGAEALRAATSENYLKLLVPRSLDSGPFPRCRLRELPPASLPSLGDFDARGVPAGDCCAT
jgi:threonylcarbamoyladenosine tRNA methylthiotransferase MtaB